MKKLTLLVAIAMLASGCETCRKYPVACTVAGTIVVGSVAATIAANQPDHRNAITDVKRVIK